VTVTATDALRHLEFGERRGYGNPQPSGIAFGFLRVTGDASGSTLVLQFTARANFLYRLELILSNRGDTVDDDVHAAVTHQWAADAGGPPTASNVSFFSMERFTAAGFRPYAPAPAIVPMLSRFPLSASLDTSLVMLAVTYGTNTNTIVYECTAVLTFWRPEARFYPSFLQTFWQAPVAFPAFQGLLGP